TALDEPRRRGARGAGRVLRSFMASPRDLDAGEIGSRISIDDAAISMCDMSRSPRAAGRGRGASHGAPACYESNVGNECEERRAIFMPFAVAFSAGTDSRSGGGATPRRSSAGEADRRALFEPAADEDERGRERRR